MANTELQVTPYIRTQIDFFLFDIEMTHTFVQREVGYAVSYSNR